MDVILDDQNVDLVEAGIDIALRMGDLLDSTLTARRIAESPRLVVGTPAYFDRAGHPKTPQDLTSHQTVIYDQRGGGVTFRFQRDSDADTVTVNGRVRTTAAEGVREAVLADLGVAVASEWMFSPELARGRVVRALSDWQLPSVALWAVFPTGKHPNAKARAFAKFIEHQLTADASATQ
jgi:DNA-binding transcriptional LysR family regulator